MIEIVFNESAAGSLMEAKSLGEGQGGLCGHPSDVFCFPLALDVGPIDGDLLGRERASVLADLFSVYPFGREAAKDIVAAASDDKKRLEARAGSNEPIRIWYSSEPSEMCGCLWFSSVLQSMTAHGPVDLVHLPGWEKTDSGSVVLRTGWGEVSPKEWAACLQFSRTAPELLIAGRQFDWTLLQQENASLRAVISGKVMSVPDSFYDFLILHALESMENEFPEALLIGTVLGRSQVGMSDAWLASRIADMVASGRLEVVKPCTDPEAPTYHRVLKKC